MQCHSALEVELGRKTAGNTVSLALTPPGETDGSSDCVLFQTQVEVVAIEPICATVPQLARPKCYSIISYTCAHERLLGNHYGREFPRTFAFVPVLGLWQLSDKPSAGPLSQQNPDKDITYCTSALKGVITYNPSSWTFQVAILSESPPAHKNVCWCEGMS